MKYLCLIYNEEERLDALSPEQYRAVEAECLAYEESLRKSGNLIAVEALQPVQTATTVRVRNGRASVTDGPYAETREQLGGFYLIDARDLNEAMRIASRIPPARFGSVEVRPIRELEGPLT